MPAPNIETILDVETAIEEGIQLLLARSEIRGYTQQEFQDLKNPRVDIQLALGQATGHFRPAPDGTLWRDAWAYRLTLGLCTERDTEDPRRHGLFRARIRMIMQYGSGKIDDPTLFPYHVLSQVMDAGTAPSVVSADDCDLSELSYSGVVSVRKGAWPA